MTAQLLQTAQWVGLVLGLACAAGGFWLACDHLIDRFLAWYRARAIQREIDAMPPFTERRPPLTERERRLHLAMTNSTPRVH